VNASEQQVAKLRLDYVAGNWNRLHSVQGWGIYLHTSSA